MASPYDGTVFDNGDPTGGDSHWVHRTFVSKSNFGGNFVDGVPSVGAGVSIGYNVHFPPTWLTEPNRKFPVIYYQEGNGSTENWLWTGSTTAADPIPSTTIAGILSNLNWDNASTPATKGVTPIVLVECNGGLTAGGFDAANNGAPMYGVYMMMSAFIELINEIETNYIPHRVVPQGWNDPLGYRGRCIIGHSLGVFTMQRYALLYPNKFAAAFLLAPIAYTAPSSGSTVAVQMFNNDLSYFNNGTPDFLLDNLYPAAVSSGIFFHGQSSTGEGGNVTEATNYFNKLATYGVAHDALELIGVPDHTAYAWFTQPLPWAVGKCTLKPICAPPPFIAGLNTPLVLSAATLTKNDTDPQLLSFSVTSVGSPVHGSVSLSGTTVTFTPAGGYSGPASFQYTVTNTDGLATTATALVTVEMPLELITPSSSTTNTVLIDLSDNPLVTALAPSSPSPPGDDPPFGASDYIVSPWIPPFLMPTPQLKLTPPTGPSPPTAPAPMPRSRKMTYTARW